MTRYLDDYQAGDRARFGAYVVSREEVLDFARAYDPQDFHLSDEGGAANPLFGGLVASGWHTVSMSMRMLVDHRRATGDLDAILAGAGIDELRWMKPVRPGDTLSVEAEILEVLPSRSNPARGTMRSRSTIFNQAGEAVASFVATEMLKRRPA